MGAFVLGVLVGWLAEWLFYTFWVKEGENNDDCSGLKAELEAKNRQISSLQAQLKPQTESAETTNKVANKSTVKKTKANTSKTTKSSTSSKSSTKPKSTTTKKATSAPTKTTTSKSTTAKPRKAKTGGDDFTKLSGIGPSMSATLKSLGIDTFAKLAATDDDILRDMLEQSGARMNNNKDVMDSWNEQAQVAAKGDFVALKQMQEALSK